MPNWIGRGAVLGRELPPDGRVRRFSATLETGRIAVALCRGYDSPAEVQRSSERLRRLLVHPHEGLQRLLAWSVEGSEAWALTEAGTAVPLREVLTTTGLDAALVAAIGWRVLSGLEVLHAAGLVHRSVDLDHVLIDAAGGVYLAGHLLGEGGRPGPSDFATDVEAAGGLLCSALGLTLQGSAESPTGGADTGEPGPPGADAPALARTLRAIAAGATGGNVAGARSALGASAPTLIEPAALEMAARRLAELAGPAGIAELAAQPAPPGTPAQPAPARAQPLAGSHGERLELPRPVRGATATRFVATADEVRQAQRGRSERGRTVAAARPRSIAKPGRRDLTGPITWQVPIAAGAIVLVGALAWFGFRAVSSRAADSPAGQPAAAAQSAPSPASTPAPSARPTPPFPPATAGAVQSVAVQPSGACAPGGSCSVDVTVTTATAASLVEVRWVIRAFDPCTGQTTEVGSGAVTEQPGWNHVIGTVGFQLPASKAALQWAAVTTAPAAAASPVQTAGQGSC